MSTHRITETLSRATGHSNELIFDHFSNHVEAATIVFTLFFGVISGLLLVAFVRLTKYTDLERGTVHSPLLASWLLFFVAFVSWLTVAFLVIPGTIATALEPDARVYEKLLSLAKEYGAQCEVSQDHVDTTDFIQEIETEINNANALIEEYENDVLLPNPEIDKIIHGEYH